MLDKQLLLTRAEAGEVMGVCAHTVDRMIKNEGLKVIRRGQRFVRIHRDDLHAFIEDHRGSGKRYV